MEALVVMPLVRLANAVLETLVGLAGTAMVDKVALVQGVQKDVEFIQDELPMMHALLRASSPAYTAGGGGDLQTVWVKQLRDLAFDIEDGLLDLMLLRGMSADLPGIAKRIGDLRAKVEALHERNTRYQACPHPDQHGDDDSETTLLGDRCHQAIIGRDGDKKALAKLVRRDGATVVAVWGMAGVGKSSLARMLYDDSDLIGRFDRRAWLTMPHPLEGAEVFGRLLQEQIGVDEKKRCLVVVDDVYSHEDWEHVTRCIAANHAGGRVVVLVTTREEDVARRCSRDGGGPYELKGLPHKEAQRLLCQKVYKNANYKLTNDMGKQAKFILERCRGIPLAIAAIGGLLANRPKISSEWTNLQEQLMPELASFALDVKRVISLTYDGLPYYVKFCFLYVSIFPRNHEIRRTRLLRRWMAELYIEKQHDMTLEEVAWSHYNKLINRRMIEPSNKSRASMTSECCRVHDRVLQIILPKSIEDIQLFIMDKHCNEAPQSNVRHLVVARQKRREKMARIKLTHLRSLTVFGECPVSLITRKLRLLRVLDLEDTVGLKNDDLKDIGQLPHLRYLGLRGTNISELPSSLQNLRFLETLDVKDTNVTHLPAGVNNLENLCYLRVGANFAAKNMGEEKNDEKRNGNFLGTLADLVCRCHGGYIEGCESGCAGQFSVRTPKKIEKLIKLKVLGVVHIARSQEARKLRKLTNLRKLGVHLHAASGANRELCSSISSLVRLEQLEVHSESLEFLKSTSQPPPRHLLSLRLCGHLGNLPSWMSSLTNLSKIKLLLTGLKQEDIEVIGGLPNVILLALWEKSFEEETLSFGKGKFQNLKMLDIEGMEKVKTIRIEHGALLALEKLRVRKCPMLYNTKQGISSVKSLRNLNELDLTSCGDKLELEKELRKKISRLPNRPVLITGNYVNLERNDA